MKCYGCGFKVKLVYDAGLKNINVFSYSKHFHDEPVKKPKGINNQLKQACITYYTLTGLQGTA